MQTLSVVAQIIVAVTIAVVWIGRFDNIVKEFKQYHLPDIVRNLVGAVKIVLSTLLVVGIWYPNLVLIPAILMALLMLSAQWFHYKAKNPIIKFVPSLVMLALCLFITGVHSGHIA